MVHALRATLLHGVPPSPLISAICLASREVTPFFFFYKSRDGSVAEVPKRLMKDLPVNEQVGVCERGNVLEATMLHLRFLILFWFHQEDTGLESVGEILQGVLCDYP